MSLAISKVEGDEAIQHRRKEADRAFGGNRSGVVFQSALFGYP
jgi:hypothetical protein